MAGTTSSSPVTPPAPEAPVTCTADNLSAAVKTITPAAVPIQTSIVKRIRFANTDCIFDNSTSTHSELHCTLNDEPTCGEWIPQIYSAHGLIPVASTVQKIKVECTVTSITPNTDLNVLGGDNLTISGTNFPKFIADNTVEIGFSNSDSTKCVL